MEGAKSCMNAVCGASLAGDGWRKGWALRSGGFAVLCNTCGLAYEQQFFCDAFHAKESGWRECSSCHKRLHCGCIASASFLELLDGGGVHCLSCKNNLELSSSQTPMEVLQDSSAKGTRDEEAHAVASEMNIRQPHTCITDSVMNVNTVCGDKTMLVDRSFDGSGHGSSNGVLHLLMGARSLGNTNFSRVSQGPQGSLTLSCGENKDNLADRASQDSLPRGSLDINLGTLLPQNLIEGGYNARSSHDIISLSKTIHDVREQGRTPSVVQQWQRSRCLLPKPSRMNPILDTTKDMLPHMRVARPPAEGRGRAQLLPRYWPRITDQELRQISGDLNSTIVPLFEKVLSASDAGRIGRLVLPKACAEAYFPPISQPEGLPLKIQDAKGKDWVFQFRFWPNNNSRMYVLEGVTPCIQSMQLQAGDTVTFSRIDPEGKLVMGFRKATNTVPLQDSQISAIANGSFGAENFLSGVIENLPIVSGFSGFIQSIKGSTVHLLNASSEMDGGVGWQNMDNQGHKSIEGMQLQHFPGPEKRSRNIGPKRKRLHIDNEDAMELKMTWDEAQDLLRPPPSIKPSIVVVEDHEFEEYEEPPVFGKKSIFTSRTAGELDQWVQCDICSKWRRLPVDVILSSTWTCSDNLWDSKRSSCMDPAEMSPIEIHNLLQQNADFRKQKIAVSRVSVSPEQEAPGLDTLATAASLGDDASPSTSSIGPTTKHPRHRLGCTCIVCIQPPSGKGPKHEPTCTCNVCSTVKRRFKTLMMRKKKRQSEREEAEVHKRLTWDKKEAGEDSSLRGASPLDLHHDPETGQDAITTEMGKGKIDLNFNPKRGEESSRLSHATMMSLLQVVSLPLDTCMKQNGLSSLACDQQVSSSSPAIPEVPGETKNSTPDKSVAAFTSRERDSGVDEEHSGSDPACNDAV